MTRREFLTGAKRPGVVVPVGTFAGLKVLGLLATIPTGLLGLAIAAARK